MFSAFILSLIAFFRNGWGIAFINATAILLTLLCFPGLENNSKTDLNKSNQENALYIDSASSQNITFIQPFTSLAGFNWKFRKETKRKEREAKINSMPSLYLPHLIRK